MVDIVVYAHTADLIEFTPQDYESKIGSVVPGNLTNFVVAFKKVDDVLRQRAGEFKSVVCVCAWGRLSCLFDTNIVIYIAHTQQECLTHLTIIINIYFKRVSL